MSEPEKTPLKPVARAVAVSVILAVLKDHKLLETALDGSGEYQALSSRDRAFARLLVTTVFRRMGQIDKILAPYIKREPPIFVKTVLRIGAAQILVLKTPAHAAVGESVALVKSRAKYRSFSGLINAVLRRVVENGPKAFAKTIPQDNLPGWLRGSWEKAYGRADMRRMAAQLTQIPPLDITVKSDPDKWAVELGGQVIMDHTVRLAKAESVPSLAGFEQGDWWVQDLSAALPVRLLGDVSGRRVLDMCAAPGGKTLQLAHKGARVTALDKSKHRLKRVEANLRRTRLEAEFIHGDALEWGNPDRNFDIVLLDAPCSATGTFRRHPDVIHNKSPKAVADLVRLQDRLLARAANWLRPGGVLLYCTCSLQPEEGEERIVKLLKSNNNFELSDIDPGLFPGFPETAIKSNGIRILPHFLSKQGGVDGFFTAKLDCKA